MTMKSTLSLLVLVTCLVSGAANTFAARLYRNVMATRVFNMSVSLSAGQHTFWTTGGNDTVLHLWSNSGLTEVAMNDDCWTGQTSSPNSCVTYTVPATGYYTVIIHAYLPGNMGFGNVYKDNVLWQTSQYFGGTRLSNLPGGTSESDRYETGFRSGGSAAGACTDTVLYALDSNMHLIRGISDHPYFDDDSGVGYSSRITGTAGSTNITAVVVGAYGSASEGPVDFFVNDYLNDADGNGLGDQLDAEIAAENPGYCL
jgi:hypothetical protein